MPNIPVIDIHCHPALKMYLFGGNIGRGHSPGADGTIGNVTDMHVDLPSLRTGGVHGLVSVLHLPEHGLIEHTGNVLIRTAMTACAGKFEARRRGRAPFEQTLAMMDMVEKRLKRVHDNGQELLIAKNARAFGEHFQAGGTTFLHSLEGAHMLGTGTLAELLERLDELIDLGLCQITLAHFFDNEICASQGGIPPGMKHELRYKGPEPSIAGLNQQEDKGPALVRHLLQRGIIVDLTHCTPAARQEVYTINRELGAGRPLRPLVFSHTGLRQLVANDMVESDKLCLPDEDEVKGIIATDGLIGIIFMNYWLNGIEEDDPRRFEGAIELVVRTAKELKKIDGGSCKHIAIGTDLDGFSQTPDDLTTEAAMPELFDALRVAGFSEDELMDIGHRNYLRVLRNGWGHLPA